MKKAKLTLTLNKETVANLNSSEMNGVKGGEDNKSQPNMDSCLLLTHCLCPKSWRETCDTCNQTNNSMCC